ncbi:LacI family DNA-binding transcriptional regulator [Asticcacaulis sp. AND118]|uniref:LacI family DNA-binding transcriptional regulator n=1 Tax=Asticcacaulis sp. AND118 TaxID=2840468 RepID=UPI001CFFB33D|nr:LacI family DNA-binding transcriptional regulator [Asticcacaulis sp. AND118]UDF05470.1 LacI family DNA-binding transcriptional regulator [Asticcacaulis sp. AND118]
MTRITIVDLARMSGVSIKTVSRVLNKQTGVRPEKRAEIEKLIADTGFKPNPAARALSGSRSYLIGLIFERPVTHYYQHELQIGALDACRQAGYHLVIEGLADLRHLPRDQMKAQLATSRFDGVVLAPPVCDDAFMLDLFDELEVPVVRISPVQHFERSPYVFIDDEAAGYDLTRWLIELGHRRIAFIENLRGRGSNEARKAGYRQALADAGLESHPEWIVRGDVRVNNGFDEAETLLSRPDRPTAIFAAADYIAFGAMAAAAKLKLSVPEDLSIVGFDDAPGTLSVWPPLSTVHQPMKGLAEEATRMLLERINGRDVPAAHQLDYFIAKRQSAAAPK